MRSRWNLPIYLAYAAVCLVVLGFIAVHLNVRTPWSHPYTVSATFADADSILVNNEVLMNGTKVGYVSAVSVVSGRAVVQLTFDDPAALPLKMDATAEVRKKNLLGETYIDLTRGSATTAMASGGAIPLEHTVPITAIDQVLAIFDPQTVQRVQLLIDALGQGTANNGSAMNSSSASLRQLLTALQGPSTVLSVHRQQVSDIVQELQRLYDVLANQRVQVREEFGTWNAVMQQLARQEASIGGTVRQADTLLQNLDVLVNGSRPGESLQSNIRSTVGQLPATLAQLDAFLTQTNQVLGNVAQYRTQVHDIFPHLGSSFADTDPTRTVYDPVSGTMQPQHFWSIYSVNCGNGCNSSPTQGTPPQTAPNDAWQAAMGAGW